MEIIGLIAEYNPFHNGHYYQIKKIKEKYNDSIIILIMSGNFTERGDTSIINKWDKTEIALSHQIDLVIELPFYFACNSSNTFAKGSIALLNELKASKLIFGSEKNDINYLQEILKVEKKEEFQHEIKRLLDLGNSYPKSYDLSLHKWNLNIHEPNDLLGLSYLRELEKTNSQIIPETIQRTNHYHDTTIKEISSASAIRKALQENRDISKSIPKETQKYLHQHLHFLEEYFPLLKYKIISEPTLKEYYGVEEGLESRIKSAIFKSTNLEQLIGNIKTKRYTYNRIKRTLVYILCNIKKEDVKNKDLQYIRILGFNEKGKKYLNKIKKNLTIPLITSYTNDKHNYLKLDTKVTNIYYSIRNEQEKITLMNQEQKQHPIMK